MEAEISMVLYPDCTGPYVRLYLLCARMYLDKIEAVQRNAGEEQLDRLGDVYSAL